MNEQPILWTPDATRRTATAMYRFMTSRYCNSYEDLHRWSIDRIEEFWQAL